MIDQYTLFLDNFRGFKNTYVPLLDVNFLVGENSSGKTSVLTLLKLLGADRLLMANEFSDEDVSLGPFEDIVSAHADKRDYFRIGMIRRNSTPKGQMPMGVLITYEKQDGLPVDTSLTCTYENKEISIRRKGGHAYYRVRADAVTPATKMSKLFSKWIEEQRTWGDDLKKFTFRYDPEASLLFPLSVVAQDFQPRVKDHVPLLNPILFEPLIWVAPIRAKPRRTHDQPRRSFSSEGMHTPYLIRKILDSDIEAKRFSQVMSEVGKASGLFQSVAIKRFGKDSTDPFEVHIVLDQKSFNILNVGYGVSQVLPVLVEMLWRGSDTWFAVQQPEVHLHPRAQAALGDLIFNLARSEKKRFLIETHSDFTIDRFRSNFRGQFSKKPSSQILFFERKNRMNTITQLRIGEAGELPETQPKSYRRFFIKEQMELLGL